MANKSHNPEMFLQTVPRNPEEDAENKKSLELDVENSDLENENSVEARRKKELQDLADIATDLKSIADKLPLNDEKKARVESALKRFSHGIEEADRTKDGGHESNLISVDELIYLTKSLEKQAKWERNRVHIARASREAFNLTKTYVDLNVRDNKKTAPTKEDITAAGLRAYDFTSTDPSNPLIKHVNEKVGAWLEEELKKDGADEDALKKEAEERKRHIFAESMKAYKDYPVTQELPKDAEFRRAQSLVDSENITTEAQYLSGYTFKRLNDPKNEEERKTFEPQVKELLKKATKDLKDDPELFDRVKNQYFDEINDEQGGNLNPDADIDIDLLARKYLENKKYYKLPAEEGLVRFGEKNTKLAKKETTELENRGETALEKRGVTALEKTAEKKVESKKAYLVDITEVAKRMAWTKAEEMLKKKFDNSNFIKRAWKSLSENGYRIKYYQKALEEIQNDNNLMKAIRGRVLGEELPDDYIPSNEDYFKVLDKVVEQFDEELADKDRETGEIIKGNDKVSSQAADLFRRHANGNWDDLGEPYNSQDLSEREKVELYVRDYITPILEDSKWRDENVDDGKKGGLLYASNFWQLAESYKESKGKLSDELVEQNPEQKEAILKHIAGLENLDVQLGFKQRDLANNKPKGILRAFEEFQDWSENSVVLGKLNNPVMWGIGAALTSRGVQSVAKWAGVGLAGATGIAAGSVLLPLGIGAGVAGAYAYYRRSKSIKHDVAQEQRQETLGGEGSKILDDAEARYNTMQFQEAYTFLEELRAHPEKLKDKATQDGLARIFAMRQYEKDPDNTVDLFRLTEEEGQKYGTTEVAKTDLDKILKSISQMPGFEGEEFQKLISDQKEVVQDDINLTEDNVQEFRRKESRKYAAFTAVMALAGGLLMQQAVHEAGRFFGSDYYKTHFTAIEQVKDYAKEWLHPGSTKIPTGRFIESPGETTFITTETFQNPTSSSSITSGEVPWRSLVKLDRDWHDEVGRHGVRNLLFEGKQQQGDLILDRASNKVSASMDRMMGSLAKNLRGEGQAGVNWDQSVDTKLNHILGEMKSHQQAGDLQNHMRIRVFPENGSQGYVAGHLDSNNNMQFSDGERNAFFDANGKQMARYIEYGYEDDKGNFHTFATSVGHGVKVPEITSIDQLEQMKTPTPPGVTELTPGVKVEEMADPVYNNPMPTPPLGRKVWLRGEKPEEEEEIEQLPGEYNEKQIGQGPTPEKPKGRIAGIKDRTKEGFKEGYQKGRDFVRNTVGGIGANRRAERASRSDERAREDFNRKDRPLGIDRAPIIAENSKEIIAQLSDEEVDNFAAWFMVPDSKVTEEQFSNKFSKEQRENLAANWQNFSMDTEVASSISELTPEQQRVYFKKLLEVMTRISATELGDDKIIWAKNGRLVPGENSISINYRMDANGMVSQIHAFMRIQRRRKDEVVKPENPENPKDESPESDIIDGEIVEENVEQAKVPEWVSNKEMWNEIFNPENGQLRTVKEIKDPGKSEIENLLLEATSDNLRENLNRTFDLLLGYLNKAKQKDPIHTLIERVSQLDQEANDVMLETISTAMRDKKRKFNQATLVVLNGLVRRRVRNNPRVGDKKTPGEDKAEAAVNQQEAATQTGGSGGAERAKQRRVNQEKKRQARVNAG